MLSLTVLAEQTLLQSAAPTSRPGFWSALKYYSLTWMMSIPLKDVWPGKGSNELGLKLIPFGLSTTRIAVFAGASFPPKEYLTSQIGLVVTFVKDSNNTNVLHYSSFKSKWAKRSVLSSRVVSRRSRTWPRDKFAHHRCYTVRSTCSAGNIHWLKKPFQWNRWNERYNWEENPYQCIFSQWAVWNLRKCRSHLHIIDV